MDAQDFRSLQEAYIEVVENQQQLDEAKKPLPTTRMRNQARSAWNKAKEASETGNETERRKQVVRYNAISMPDTRRAHLKSKNEEFDIYDIILSHLLDEGYAETSEAAEAIMVNMSEKWREDILDEAVEIMSVTSPEGKRRKGSRIYSGRHSQVGQTARKLAALQKRQRENPKAMSSRSARAQAAQEVESNAKKSIRNLNVDPNSEVKHGYDNTDREGYREVPTDYRARRRRASGR